MTNRIDPGEEANEDGVEPRLFVHWDETSFEDEVDVEDLMPEVTR
ncbi:hypothetical protein [Saccharopolyspora soli]|nr:hypothetical protein [Saccharopolyspora soli]